MSETQQRRALALAVWLIMGLGTLGVAVGQEVVQPLDGVALVHERAPNGIAYWDASQTLSGLSDLTLAEPLADQLVAQYPADGQNWLRAATIKRKLGKFDAAAADYREVIKRLGPSVPGRARYWLAVCQTAVGNKAGALLTLHELVWSDHFVNRPSLLEDAAFRSLKADPQFQEIAGEVDTTGWDRTRGWRYDIDYLAAEISRVNPDYHDRPLPPAFEASRRKLKSDVTRLSDPQVFAEIWRLLASLHQGHTSLWPFMPAKRMVFTSLPLQFYAFPEGLFVVDAAPEFKDLIGAQVLKLETTAAEDALRRIGEDATASDSGMEVLWLGPQILSLAQELVGLGIAKRTDQIELTLRMSRGETATRTLATTNKGFPSKLHAAPGRTAPLAFRDVDKEHWFTLLPEAAAIYVQVNQVIDSPDEGLAAFGRRLRQELKSSGVRNVILDLRHNNGGNTFTYVELLRTLVAFSQEDGNRLYVIIGRGVYSAAGNLVTDLERLAAPVFVGEPTAMTGNNYGDESQFRLPYSGLYGGLTSLKWQLGYPDDKRRSLIPQVPIALTAADYFAGRDTVLEGLIDLIHHRP